MGFQAFVMSILLLVACSGQGEAAQEQVITAEAPEIEIAEMSVENETDVIVMLGDSLTAGYGLPDEAALPSVVQRKLITSGYDVNVINAGVSGDTTSMARARYDWSVASADPDILVIALGANDFLSGLPPSVARANLIALIERAQGDEILVVLAGLEPRSIGGEGSLEDGYSRLYPELANTYGVPLYPDLMAGVWDHPELLLGDGLHPTVEGVEIMAAGLVPVIEEVLTSID